MDESQLGYWSFIAGLILAVIGAFISMPNTIAVLAILGVIIGLLNVSVRETTPFLVASIALIVASQSASLLNADIAWLAAILNNFGVLVAFAAIVVSMKALYELAQY